MRVTARELAELTQGKLEKIDPDTVLTGFASLSEAESGDVSFLGNERYRSMLHTTKASLVAVSALDEQAPEGVGMLVVPNASVAFAQIVEAYAEPRRKPAPGAHPTAVIAASARVNLEKVSIGPYAVIGENVCIGDGSEIGAQVVIGDDCTLGEDCCLFPHVSLRERCVLGNRVVVHNQSVIGSDGFGYEFVNGRHQKVEQLGMVEIADDVEIGAGVTVDRARFGKTVIGEGTKIDNQGQVGHNARIGKHCVFAAHVAIAGSAVIGDYVVAGGQVGIAGHIRIADRSVFGAQSGVTKSILQPGQQWMGFPIQPAKEWRNGIVQLRRLAKKAGSGPATREE